MSKLCREERIQRFWSKVQKSDGCWEWQGSRVGYAPHQYGNIRGFHGKNVGAHRFAYEVCVGSVPKGLGVLHKCDNPLCVNPDHLFLGGQRVNMQDCSKKGRCLRAKGSKHGLSVLNENDVLEILKAKKSGLNYRQIARRYRVNPVTISAIDKGMTWGWLTGRGARHGN